MHTRHQLFTIFGTLLLSTSVMASNLSFLNSTAITFFRGDDKNLMVNNITKALDKNRDGIKAQWSNPSTGSWGYAIPSHTRYSSGIPCRDLTIFNNANNVTGQSTYRFCKINGAWKITD